MKLVKPSYEIMTKLNRKEILKKIETVGRTCYKSDSEYTEETGSKFLTKIVNRGHLSVIEHVSITVKFICDRGVTHELVRHRLCAFSQESTRYCDYKGGITFIIPLWFKEIGPGVYCEHDYNTIDNINSVTEKTWLAHMLDCEQRYTALRDNGWTPQQARSILPNSLKTEIVTTANLREWKHIFNMRCAITAHPQMREIMIPLLEVFKKVLPELF